MTISKLSKGHNLRWESSRMMLPEHVEQFQQYQKNRGKVSKPTLDEQKLEEINDIIRIAIEDYTPVYLDRYIKGEIKTIRCYINKFKPLMRELNITLDNAIETIKLDDVLDARVI